MHSNELSFDELSFVMSGWSSPSLSSPGYSSIYRTFHPDEYAGLARLIELIVFVRQGPMSIGCLDDILRDMNDSIQHSDLTTFIQKNCRNLSFIVIDGIVKCKFNSR